MYDFYSLCDELGILAWSELEFSDALYPNDTLSLQNIEPEVRQNVRRVNEHPSNAQWAGGNEIEGIARSTGGFYLDQVRSISPLGALILPSHSLSHSSGDSYMT